MFKSLGCWLFGHVDKRKVGSLTRLVCLRCQRETPEDSPEQVAEWIRAQQAADALAEEFENAHFARRLNGGKPLDDEIREQQAKRKERER